MKVTHFRPAIAMIELIFAIVIMGIVMMSAPMLISTAKNSTTVVLQQEGVNQAVSRITMLLTYPWDESDTNDSCIPPVLIVTNGDSELQPMDINASRRSGVPVNSKSRKFNSCGDNLNASTLVSDATDAGKDDIDDFINSNTPLNLIPFASVGGQYIGKDHVNMITSVTYGSDTATYSNGGTSPIVFTPSNGTATSNIKNIDVNVTTYASDAELKNTIVMHAFTCNIGGIAYEEKVLP